jgi:hypothetical protein
MKLNGIEAILKVSGVAAYLPTEIKDKVCHSVAVDIVAYYEPLLEKAKVDFGLSVHEAAWRQARQEVREIFEAYDAYIESLGTDLNKLTQQTIKHEREHKAKIQSLKSKYLKEEKQNGK